MNGFRLSLTIALVGLLLVPGAMTALAAADSPPTPCEDRDTSSSQGPPDECEGVNGAGASENGVDGVTFWKLWSGDDDIAGGEDVDLDSETPQYEKVLIYSSYADFTFQTPPDAAETWNSNDHGDFSPGGRQQSVYPDGADTYDDFGLSHGAIRDAHVTLFNVGPSTIVHKDGSTTRYVASSGTVRAVADFRVELDEDSGTCADSYSVTGTSSTVELSVDGTVVDSTSSKTATLRYSGLTGSHRLWVTATYEVRVRHVDRSAHTHGSGDTSWTHCHSDTHTHTHTMSVSDDAVDVTLYEPPSVDARELEYTGSDRAGLALEPSDTWATVRTGEVLVRSNWEFYTQSRTGWGEMVTSSESGDDRDESSVRPLEVHAFPTNDTVNVEVTDSDVSSDNVPDVANMTSETRIGVGGLPVNIKIRPATEYESVQAVTLNSPDASEIDISDGRVTGLVAGQTRSVSVEGPTTVHETELTLVSKEPNDDGTYTLDFEVVTGSGDPVDAGQVVINGSAYDVSGGSVSATVDPVGFAVSAEYQPPTSASGDDQYQPSDTYVPLNSNVPSAGEIFRFGAMVFAWLIPFALLGIAMDYFLGTTFFRDSIPGIMDAFRAIRDAIAGGNKE